MRTSNRKIAIPEIGKLGKFKATHGAVQLLRRTYRRRLRGRILVEDGFLREPVVAFRRKHGAVTWWTEDHFETVFGE